MTEGNRRQLLDDYVKIEEISNQISALDKDDPQVKVLKEELVNDRHISPDPSEKQGNDPLTPTDQKFATLQDLAANYRLFVNRVEQQLYTIGGGGAGFIKDLDDVSFDSTNNDLLIYHSETSKWVGIASTSLGSSTLTCLLYTSPSPRD